MQFYLKQPKEVESLVMMRIYDASFKDGVFNYSTRERIPVNKWDHKKGKPRANQGSAIEALQGVLLRFENEALTYMRDNRTYLTREGLRDYLNGTRPKEEIIEEIIVDHLSIVEEWEQYLKTIEGTVGGRTMAGYKTPFEAFKDFMEPRINLKPIDFDFKTYNAYMVYLRGRYKPNSAARHLKTFKRLLTYLEKVNVKVGFDKEEIKYKESAGLKLCLTEEQLNKVYNHKFYGFTDKMRWLFLLQCNTGLRISDLFRVIENITGDFIVIETQKTGTMIRQPLTPIVKDVLKRLDYKIPTISEQKYRDYIKTIYKAIDPTGVVQIRDHKTNSFKNVHIHEEISSHDAVRTFITRCMNKGITASTVALMTGKTIQVILKHYYVSSIEVAQKEMLEKFSMPDSKPKQKRRSNQSTLSLGL